jgi:hypothetical protein
VLRVELELPGANLKGTRFQNQAASLNVSAESLYAALVADAENLPPNFDLQGRQADAWIEHHYLPIDARRTVPGSVRARVVSRALEVRGESSHLPAAEFPNTVCV